MRQYLRQMSRSLSKRLFNGRKPHVSTFNCENFGHRNVKIDKKQEYLKFAVYFSYLVQFIR